MTALANDAQVYRRVLNGSDQYKKAQDGTVRISSQAFTDREWRPSVDIASLCPSGPAWTQGGADNGVLGLTVAQVRTVVVSDNKHQLDVVPAPTTENGAHAEIRPTPDYANEKMFRRVREVLAKRAVWVLQPADLR